MFKFLIISILLIYIVARFAGYFFRVAYWLTGQEQPRGFGQGRKKQASTQRNQNKGDLNIYVPTANKQRKEFTGGEYVDFEEVKGDKG